MTREEAISAFKAVSPVIHSYGGSDYEYLKISALIYRLNNGTMQLTVELLDKCKHAVTIASPASIRLKEE